MVTRREKTGRSSATRVVAAPGVQLCLDFANTRYWRGTDAPTETLADAEALLRWAATAGLADAATVRALRAQSDDLPAWHGEALRWREAMYQLFAAQAQGQVPAAKARQLSALVAQAPPRQAVSLGSGPPGWRIDPTSASPLACLLAPVLWSAADLALGASNQPLRLCDNPKCRWLFLDRSKTGTRRWCDMGACGNRAKAQRHLQRRRAREAMA